MSVMSACDCSSLSRACPHEMYPRPTLNPLPLWMEGVGDSPVVSLDGFDWWALDGAVVEGEDASTLQLPCGVTCGEKGSHVEAKGDDGGWQQVSVPAQRRSADGRRVYARRFTLPEQWDMGGGSSERRVWLRFDGVNCAARVFVDGRLAGSHYGGFMGWDCEITDCLASDASCSGRGHVLVVEAVDDHDTSPMNEGGIIREVRLYATPRTHVARLHALAEPATGENAAEGNVLGTIVCREVCGGGESDGSRHIGELSVDALVQGGVGELKLRLTGPDGDVWDLGVLESAGDGTLRHTWHLDGVRLWDSEHPNLYMLEATLLVDGREMERVSRRIGFRRVEKHDNQVFVNGELVKLRGINHHDIDAERGRCVSHEQVERDVQLLVEANINFVRTSHYPPREDFLDLCDEKGIYVEDEMSVAFIGYGAPNTQDDPACLGHYVGPCADTLERDMSHPSVIVWSLGNESRWGRNTAAMLKYVRATDPSRLTIFSYPLTVRDDEERPDIWSAHYVGHDSKLDDMTECFRRSEFLGEPMPVLHDESTHIPCYDLRALRRDPGIRDFWGLTVERFWNRLWSTPGTLGCAIWAMIDDVRSIDGAWRGPTWGIVDVMRRPKPEYWHVRKAFSPVVVEGKPMIDNGACVLRISNRFNHTNLAEVTVRWSALDREGRELAQGRLNGPDVPARGEGELCLPAAAASGDRLFLRFTDARGVCMDERSLPVGAKDSEDMDVPGESRVIPANMETSGRVAHPVRIERADGETMVLGEGWSLSFNDATGLITSGEVDGHQVLQGGPSLHLTAFNLDLDDWQLESFNVEADASTGGAHAVIRGGYGPVRVRFDLAIDPEGVIDLGTTVEDMPWPSPRKIAVTSSISSHCGGYDEVGVSFLAPASLDRLDWRRDGQWDVYPDWHPARLDGHATKRADTASSVTAGSPTAMWKDEETDTCVFGPDDRGGRGTRDFRSMKTHIRLVCLNDGTAGVTPLSQGGDAARMEVTDNPANLVTCDDPRVRYHGAWFDHPDHHHSSRGHEMWTRETGASCELEFDGTGIQWRASLDGLGGIAEASVDDGPARRVSLAQPGGVKSATGYDILWRREILTITGLTPGHHTLRVKVLGEPAPGSANAYVRIDDFLVLDGNEEGPTRFIIDHDWNYTELSWADYTKPPVTLSSGDRFNVRLTLRHRKADNDINGIRETANNGETR